MSETPGDNGPLRDLIWEAAGALAKAATGLRREARENEKFGERLSSLRSQQPLTAEDRSFWADLLEGRLSRTRGRPGRQNGQPIANVSGAILRKAALTKPVQRLIRVLRLRDEEVPAYARELLAELFAGRFVRSTGQPVVRIETLRMVAEAYVAERAEGTTTEVAAEKIGRRFQMHERTVLEYVAEWRDVAPYLGPKLTGKSE